MKKIIVFILAMTMIWAAAGCSTDAGTEGEQTTLTVAVGIVPEATFIEKIAGDLVDVVILIPAGNSPANYEPTTAEMQALSDASVYFSMQTPTEVANILPTVSDFNEDIDVVYLRDEVSTEYSLRMVTDHDHDEDSEEEHDEDEEEEEEESVDPHIWLSPQRVIYMVELMAEKLCELDEENAETYTANAEAYIAELEALDAEIQEIVSGIENKTFIIYHGAYGYFADDYGLEMVAIEIDGKQVTAAELSEVIDLALEEGITTVYYQDEFDDSQAVTVADEIGGNVAQVAPLSADYIESLRAFAEALAD